ncbi:MAG: membrane-bound lytic murein transglycosylase MltF [Casimicrobiaceae bacterium]
MFAALAGMAGCDHVGQPPSLTSSLTSSPPLPDHELVVVVRPGPATFYDGPDGQPAGLDADLARLFAAHKHRMVRFVPAANARDLVAAVAAGKAHIGAGGLYRPAAVSRPRGRPQVSDDADDKVLWSGGYFQVEPVLIYNVDGFKPRGWKDLAGARVAYMPDTGLDGALEKLRAQHPDIIWVPANVASGDALIAKVSDGALDYAIVGSSAAALARNVYLDFDIAFPIDGRRELAFVVPPGNEALRDEINAWLAGIRRNGMLARLEDRHFGHVGEVPRLDASVLQDRIRSTLPQYRQVFELAQQATGIEWRLLAAVAYQESQWDPQATSETGVRGMMQLTEDTARHLGVVDRLDPKLSIHAAAHYLRTLKSKLPKRIAEPDRTWLALAAFNIGLGHLEDARVLAQKQKLNPDSWTDVKKTLPLLAQPEYYGSAKLGYARGGMPVAFVDRVRSYYDVLLVHQPGYRPRLQVAENATGWKFSAWLAR